MSHKGLDFNGNGHVSRTESHMTYNIIRNGAKNSGYSSSSSYRPSGNSSASSAAKSEEDNKIQKPRYKHTRFVVFILIVLLISALFIGKAISKYNQTVKSYKWAIEEIKDGDYRWALRCLEELKEKDYKDSEYLYYYMQSLNTDNSYTAAIYLEKIPDDYSGIFSRDIALEKINYIERCKTEKKIKADKERAEQEANNKKRQEARNALMPFVGMSTEYINDTRIGKYDEYESQNVDTRKGTVVLSEYKWYSDDYKRKLVLVVYAENFLWEKNGVVTDFSKFSEDVYWDRNGNPDFKDEVEGSKYGINSFSSGSYEEKYDVDRFYWAEDFYYFYYYDFRDFDEAKDYFEEHKKS